jgi:hypothetical protein
MGLLTFLFPAWRAAEAAERAASSLAKQERTERIKALAALQQVTLDSETQAQVQAMLSQELAGEREQLRRVIAAEAQRDWDWKCAGWILVLGLVFVGIVGGLSQCSSSSSNYTSTTSSVVEDTVRVGNTPGLNTTILMALTIRAK